MSNVNHTPVPWEAIGLMIKAGHETIAHLGVSNNFRPPRPYECEANASHIVKCVNSHDELVEALDYLLEQTVDQDLKHGISLTEGEEDARQRALAVIAKVAA